MAEMIPEKVHLVGSIALDTVEDVFRTTGKLLGRRLKRVPDGVWRSCCSPRGRSWA